MRAFMNQVSPELLNNHQASAKMQGFEDFATRALLALSLLLVLAGSVHADLNGDGISDAVFAIPGAQNRLCLGDAAGGFSICSDVSPDALSNWSVAFGDMNGDGSLDIVFSGLGQNERLCLNNGSGSFICSNMTSDFFATNATALGDLDGDGDLDAVFANLVNEVNRLCTNNGSGSFTCANVSADGFDTADVALGDVNSDGSLDIVFANASFPNQTCLNNGSGSFTCSNLSTDVMDLGVALGDLDGDGDLDAVFARFGATDRTCTNDGSGNFSCANVSGNSFDTRGVALGDVDGDGDLDAVFADYFQANRLCTNDGSGIFSCATLAADAFATFAVALGDIDGDGDDDAVFANNSQPDRVCTNDGTGSFSCADVSPDPTTSVAVAVSPGGLAPTAPELGIATDIPGAESEAVDVDVNFSANGATIVATAFSIDYDATCLSFDDSDVNPTDGIPDALAVHVPADFTVTVFHDLGDSDGEIDILISDFSPPFATLADGPLVTPTFTVTCSPTLGSTIAAAVDFSTDPAATFSDDLAQNVPGTVVDGSVEIFPGPRGDCNSDGSVGVADVVAEALEIFDGDGTFWTDVVGGTFVGSPVGCDANADTAVNAGDVSCTTLLIFGGTCSGGSLVNIEDEPELVIDGSSRLTDGDALWLPVRLKSRGHGLSSLAFSLDLNLRRLRFDASDRDRDGLPDAVRFPAGKPSLAEIRFDPRDLDGELDVLISDLSGAALEDGVLLEIRLEAAGKSHRVAKHVRFSKAPEASFGSVTGDSVPGRTLVVRRPVR